MPRVHLPDGRIVDFPYDMTEAQISAEVAKLVGPTPKPAPAAPERTWTDTAVDLLPAAGGTLGGIVGGIGGTVAGMGVGGAPGAIGGATLGGGAGEAARQLVNRIRGKEAPATPLEAAKGIALEGGIQGAAEAVGGAVTKGVAAGAKQVYRGYLKPSLAAGKIGKANQIVQTALDEALPITRSGVATANRVIGELRAEVDSILANTKGRIDLKQIADKVRGFARSKYFKPGADLTDYKTALDVAERIDSHPSLGLPAGAKPTRVEVPLSQANEAKRALQETASASYGQPNANAAKKATKEGAHALRTEIEAATGGSTGKVATLNARESKLIDASRAIAQAVAREANQNKIYGVKTLFAGGVAGANSYRGDDLPTALAKGAAARIALTPGAQSLAAIVANRIAKQLGVGAASALRLAEYALSETEQEPDERP